MEFSNQSKMEGSNEIGDPGRLAIFTNKGIDSFACNARSTITGSNLVFARWNINLGRLAQKFLSPSETSGNERACEGKWASKIEIGRRRRRRRRRERRAVTTDRTKYRSTYFKNLTDTIRRRYVPTRRADTSDPTERLQVERARNVSTCRCSYMMFSCRASRLSWIGNHGV